MTPDMLALKLDALDRYLDDLDAFLDLDADLTGREPTQREGRSRV